METLEIEVINHTGAIVVCLRAEMGLKMDATEIAFNRVAAQRPPLVVVDLAGLAFISSLGMGLLVALRGGTRHHSLVRLACASGLVLDALRRAKLTELFELFDSVDLALAAAKPQVAGK
ncbi:MAG TPA: STAS domain-containing protein [Humisphaera sp.]|jgi:anti-anti-sigma factor|nr:STAS domain-containing protein [Humisphaera sp.]